MTNDDGPWEDRAVQLRNMAWTAVREANDGKPVLDTDTPAGRLAVLVMELSVHLGKAHGVIDGLRDEIKSLGEKVAGLENKND